MKLSFRPVCWCSIAVTLVAPTFLNSRGQTLTLDRNFKPVLTIESGVRVLAFQPDGEVVIVGLNPLIQSAFLNRGGVARLHEDGSLDQTYNPRCDLGSYEFLAIQSDGKLLVEGTNLFRLNLDGTLDTTFHAEGVRNQATPQPDGKIIVTGGPGEGLQRLNTDGTLDRSFSMPLGHPVLDNLRSVKVQDDGKILLAGGSYIARFNTDGSVDTQFQVGTGVIGASTDAFIESITIQGDGKIIVGGNNFPPGNGIGLARLEANGSVDSGFSPRSDVEGDVELVAVQMDGRILIAGTLSRIGETTPTGLGLARLNPDGRLDRTFNPVGILPFSVEVIGVREDGKILIGGGLTNGIARLNSDGSFDSGFRPPQVLAPAGINLVVAQPDGKSVVSGDFTRVNLSPRNGLARLNRDGTLDQSFYPNILPGQINAMLLQGDGKLLAVGLEVNPKSGSGIARFNSDGTVDQSFNPDSRFDGSLDGFMTCAVQTNGQLLIAPGSFDTYGLARLNSDGTLDQAFHLTAVGPPPDLSRGYVSSIAVQRDGKIIIAGPFGSVNGVTRTNLARLNPDGTLDTGYQPAYGRGALLLQPDGKLLIGSCVRLNPDGSLDPSFKASDDGCFDSVQPLLLPTGNIFSTVPFNFWNRPALFNGDGTPNETFATPDFGRYSEIRALAEQPDGAVLVAGRFSEVNGQPSFGLIRFKATTATTITQLKYESGNFFLTLSGDLSRSYRVEASTDLITWLALTNFTSSATSTAVVDGNAGAFQHRFYRATTVSQ